MFYRSLMHTTGTIRAAIPNQLASLLAILMSALILGSCASVPTKTMHSISANFTVPVTDPLLTELTGVTDSLELDATGEFAPGDYIVRGTDIHVDLGTTFHLALKLPITNPKLINIADASGQLTTGKPLIARGIALPETIILSNGKMTGEVDFVRVLGSFMFNMLQVQGLGASEGGEMRTMLAKMVITHATIKLRPDSVISVGKHRLHIGPNSSVQLNNLVVDQDLNYKGECLINMTFGKDSQYTGEKVDTHFNGGFVNNVLSVQRVNDTLSLNLAPDKPAPKITLTDCLFRFGKDKTSNAHCKTALINLKKFDWGDNQKDAKKASFHAQTDMLLSQTQLALRYPTYTVDAYFPETEPVNMSMFRDDSGHGTEFKTHQALAQTGDIQIIRPATRVEVQLTNTELGEISFSKAGELNFSLSDSTSGFKSLKWSSGKKSFLLKTSGPSTLSITKGASMDMFKEHPSAAMKVTLPLSVKFGTANVTTSKGNVIELSKLNGQMVISVDKEVRLDGTTDFAIPFSKFLGENNAIVHVQGVQVYQSAGQPQVSFKNCSIIVPQKALQAKICAQLPDEKVFDLNQEILKEKTWRYDHGILTKLIVTKPTVTDFKFVGVNGAKFNINGDVEVQGTVEKTGIFGAFKKDPKHWETRSWSASAPCTGSGTVTYKLVGSNTLADSQLQYDLKMQLPIPDNIDVDWSGVSKGLVRKAETSAIGKYLRKCTPFAGSRYFPLDRKGQVKLMEQPDARLQALRISDFQTRPSDAGTEILFIGQADL